MKSWYAMSAIGKDRPGIVADLAELIFDHGCNLEDSSMTVLGSEFAVLLLFTGEGTDLEERLSAGCKRIEWERRLTVFFRPLDGEPEGYGTREEREAYRLSAAGIDRAGLVARVCRLLAEHDVTIREMKTLSHREPESGTPLYTMQLEVGVPRGVPLEVLRSGLEHLADDLRIEIRLDERPTIAEIS